MKYGILVIKDSGVTDFWYTSKRLARKARKVLQKTFFPACLLLIAKQQGGGYRQVLLF